MLRTPSPAAGESGSTETVAVVSSIDRNIQVAGDLRVGDGTSGTFVPSGSSSLLPGFGVPGQIYNAPPLPLIFVRSELTRFHDRARACAACTRCAVIVAVDGVPIEGATAATLITLLNTDQVILTVHSVETALAADAAADAGPLPPIPDAEFSVRIERGPERRPLGFEVAIDPEDLTVAVTKVNPGGPATRLKVGDRVASINAIVLADIAAVVDLNMSKIRGLINHDVVELAVVRSMAASEIDVNEGCSIS